MKLFGQYLVEKGIIDENELLSALIQQIKEIPSVVEVVYESKLLNPTQILRALELQTRNNTDFIQACKTLGFWDENVVAKFNSLASEKQIPLGQVLVKSGKVSFQKIVNALDEYLALVAEAEKNHSPNLSLVEPQKKSSDLLEETGSPDLMRNYAELLSKEKIAAIEGLFNLCLAVISKPDSGSDCIDVLRQIYKGFHEIRGMARFVNATKTEMLAEKMESTLSELLSVSPPAIPQPAVELLSDLGKSTLHLIEGIKDCLVLTQSEAQCLSSDGPKLEKCLQDLEGLKQLFASCEKVSMEEPKEVA